MTGEELYARVWAATARAEGHMKRLPNTPVGNGNPLSSKTAKKRVERVREHAAAGMICEDIAALIGMSKRRVQEICRENNIKVRHVPFGPNGRTRLKA